MLGYSVWGDYGPAFLTHSVHGLAIEAQWKDIDFNRPSSQSNVRERTFLGGANYSWHQSLLQNPQWWHRRWSRR